MLLDYLAFWAPFHIDALGIITLFGADEVDKAVGRLARNRYTAGLPLLGAFKIAGNSIVNPQPGFVLHNTSDQILATDVTGWFARWLLCQDLKFSSTTLSILSIKQPQSGVWRQVGNFVLGATAISPLLVAAILMEDRWGLANVMAMLMSIVVRCIIVGQNHAAINNAAKKSRSTSNVLVKAIVTLPTGNAITIKTTRGIIIDCLLTAPRPPDPTFYSCVRAFGFVCYGGQAIALGVATLVNQIMTVALMLGSTALVVWQVGDNEEMIGSHLRIQRSDSAGPDFRAAAMARLDLSTIEEDTLLAWNLFPQRSNKIWWEKYRTCQSMPQHLRPFWYWEKYLAVPTLPPVPSFDQTPDARNEACA